MTNTGTNAIVTRITAADHDHMFILGTDEGAILQIVIQQTFCGALQKINRKINAFCLSAGNLEITRLLGTATKCDRIILIHQLFGTDRAPYVLTGQKGYPFRLHERYTTVNHCFVQLHVRDAVHQQSAYAIITFIHNNVVTAVIEHICHCQSGGTGSNHGNRLTGTNRRNMRLHVTARKCRFNDIQFVVVYSYR